jgi:hypothetical protein
LTAGVTPSLRFDYKATKVKQYFKLERALRTETTINNANDFGVGKRLKNLDRLRLIGRNVNHRLLSLECVAQNCAIASQTVERVVLPTVGRGPAQSTGIALGGSARHGPLLRDLQLHYSAGGPHQPEPPGTRGDAPRSGTPPGTPRAG